MFSTTCPKLVVSRDIVEMDTIYGQSYRDIEEMFNSARREFETLQEDYKLVILYKVEDAWNYQDGSGTGITLMWGVFKEIEHKNRYHWVRGEGKEMSSYWHDNFKKKNGWKVIAWTEEREQFFSDITDRFKKLIEGLRLFLTQENIEEAIAKTGRALTSGLTVE